MIKLYSYWRSTAAYRVRLALNIKQVAYSQHSVHLVKDGGEQHEDEYRDINPQGLVPTMVHGEVKISQSLAILEYLEEKYPQKIALLPENIQLRAFSRQLCQVIASDVHPLNNLRVLQYLSNSLKVSEKDRMKWYHHWLTLGFDAFSSLLKEQNFSGPYCLGRELSMADVCLIPQIYNADRFGFSMASYPRLLEINQNCLKLERFKDAIPENQPDAER
ncbi:MAG: maleylacetoacetate isomerase [Enterobacterales bacterium]|nr:maleylacetoacetate isomerase [Enterobacterales bacterium]